MLEGLTMEVEKILEKLCVPGGFSGYEAEYLNHFDEIMAPFAEKGNTDVLGSKWYFRRGKGDKTLMIEAHADKIGLMVSHITDDGFLLFSQVGGFDKKILPSTRVTVLGKEKLQGVIGSVPPHLRKKQSFEMSDLCVDIGLSGERAKEIVSVGDFIEFNTSLTLLSGRKVAASALDDRAGLAAIARCLDMLGEEGVNIVAVASTQEEVGCRGAKVAAYAIKPDYYICIDVCHGETPDASKNVFKCGGGSVITVGPNVQPFMSEKLIQVAKEKNIPYAIDVDSGNTGTNAWNVQITRQGIPTALLSIPTRYMHTMYEVASLDDIEYTARLLAEVAKSF